MDGHTGKLASRPWKNAMGDVRYDRVFERVKAAKDPAGEIEGLTDEELIAALGGATTARDPLMANVLATAAQNRARRAGAITSALGEGVVALDRDWRIALQNPSAERILGWTSEEFVGRDLHALIHPFCSAPMECHLATLPAADLFYQNDDALVMRKDGRTVRVAYTVTPMLRMGEVDGGVIVLRDSSEKKRLEEKATEKQDRLEMILQTLTEGIMTMDLAGRITYVNQAAERMLGRAARDILERTYYDPAWDFVHENGEIFPVTELPFLRAIDSGRPELDVEMGIMRGNGEVAILLVNTVPLPDANGEPYAILVSFLDVTERKRIERELALVKKRLNG